VVSDPRRMEGRQQSDFVVCPDPIAQILKQLDDGHGLIRRPVRIDEQIQTVVQTRRLMMFHESSFTLRFLDLAVACSCASLRR